MKPVCGAEDRCECVCTSDAAPRSIRPPRLRAKYVHGCYNTTQHAFALCECLTSEDRLFLQCFTRRPSVGIRLAWRREGLDNLQVAHDVGRRKDHQTQNCIAGCLMVGLSVSPNTIRVSPRPPATLSLPAFILF